MTQCDVLSKRGRSARYSYNVYDTQGKPFMLRVNGKTDYFYLYNNLGDVTSLVDSSNQVVVRYQYNSWGKVTSTQDTSGVSLATLNPFCYRKYRTVLSAGKEKERSRPIAKRKRFKTRKAAKEAAERANKTKDPIVVHPAGGKSKQPHYQPK